MSATERFRGRTAIVTGGSAGIGRAVGLRLAREGAAVVLVGRDPARLADAVAELERAGGEGRVLGLSLDVRREADMEEMARQALERFGRIDVLVASAGIGRASASRDRLAPPLAAEMPLEEWDEVLDVNLKGVFLSNRAVLPAMRAQRDGFILNVSSARGGLYGSAFASAYCASKFAVIGFSDALAEEVRPFSIRVQVLLPDAIATEMFAEAGPAVSMGRSIPPERVGDLVAHLLALPRDTLLMHPLIAPAGDPVRLGWIRRGLHLCV